MLHEQTESTSTDGDDHEGTNQGGAKPSRKISVDEINKVSARRQAL